MNIKKALEETGMARLPGSHGYKTYAQEGGGDQLRWWCDEGVGAGCHDVVSYKEIIREDWEPYIVVKEIVPEKAGELWEDNNGELYFIVREHSLNYFQTIDGLQRYTLNTDGTWDRFKNIVHNKDGWTRVYPPAEEN